MEHNGYVNSAIYSHDGDLIASAGIDGTIRIWNSERGEELHKVDAHQGSVNSVEFSPDTKFLVSGGDDGKVKFWRVGQELELVWTKQEHVSKVNAAIFSMDGTRIVSGGDNGILRIWHASSGTELLSFSGHSGNVNSIRFTQNSQNIVSTGARNEVRIWDANSGTLLKQLDGHKLTVNSAIASKGGEFIASVSLAQSLIIWNIKTEENELAIIGQYQGTVSDIRFTEDDNLIFIIHNDRKISAWDITDGVKQIQEKSDDFENAYNVNSPIKTKDEKEKQELRFWPHQEKIDGFSYNLNPKRDNILDFQFLHGNRVLLLEDFHIWLFDTTSGQALQNIAFAQQLFNLISLLITVVLLLHQDDR